MKVCLIAQRGVPGRGEGGGSGQGGEWGERECCWKGEWDGMIVGCTLVFYEGMYADDALRGCYWDHILFGAHVATCEKHQHLHLVKMGRERVLTLWM